MEETKVQTPGLLRFQEILAGGPDDGDWLFSGLGRPAFGRGPASESVELSTDPGRPSRVLEGPAANLTWPELGARYRDSLLGPRGLFFQQRALGLKIGIVAADRKERVFPLLRPVETAAKEGQGPVSVRAFIIIETRGRAVFYYGRRRNLDPDQFEVLFRQGHGSDVLEEHEAQPGQTILAPAGMPCVLGPGIMAYVVTVERLAGTPEGAEKSPDPRPVLLTAAMSSSRIAIKSLGRVDGMNAFTWLYATPSVCTARLDLRSEWKEEWPEGSIRPSFAVYTGLQGGALIRSGGDTDSIARGRTLVAPAASRFLCINPGPEGAVILKTWVPDLETDVERPLIENGLSQREILGLFGFFGRKE